MFRIALKNHYGCIILLLIFLSIITNQTAIAADANIYRSPVGHFSFQVPKDWIEVPESNWDDFLSFQQLPANSSVDSVFQVLNEDGSISMYLYIVIHNELDIAETDMLEAMRTNSNDVYETFNVNSFSSTGGSINLSAIEDRQMIHYASKHSFMKRENTILSNLNTAIFAGYILGEKTIEIVFALPADATPEYFWGPNSIINSFSFDSGYEYNSQNTVNASQNTSEKEKKAIKYISLFIVFGVIVAIEKLRKK